MSTVDLLRRLYVHGAHVDLVDDGIRVSGHPVPDDLLAELRAHRDDVLALMRDHRLGELDDGFDSTVPRRYVSPPSCLAHRACARLGPCSRFLMRRPCDAEGGTP